MKSIGEYFKLFRGVTSDKHDPVPTAGKNMYLPHQGKRECARRIRQAERMKEMRRIKDA